MLLFVPCAPLARASVTAYNVAMWYSLNVELAELRGHTARTQSGVACLRICKILHLRLDVLPRTHRHVARNICLRTRTSRVCT